MSTFQNVLGAFAAIATAFFVTIGAETFHTNVKAIGIALIPAILLPAVLVARRVFLLVVFAASRISNKILKGLLFWAPVTTISVLGLSFVALVTYSIVWMHFRNS